MQQDEVIINEYLSELNKALSMLSLEPVMETIEILRDARDSKKTVFSFGNGGSAATANIMANSFMRGVLRASALPDRPTLHWRSLTANMAVFSSWGNDASYEDVFSEQLKTLAEKGDIAIAISTSGTSPNILKGVKVAKELGLTTIGLTGHEGGKLKALVDVCFIVPSDDVEVIETIHLVFDHLVLHALRKA